MEAKHTPGPWFTIGKSIASRYRDEILAQVFRVSEDGGDLEANARLIAAAPELLEACESMIAAVMKISAYNIQKFGMFPEVDRMNAAIAKARGKEND